MKIIIVRMFGRPTSVRKSREKIVAIGLRKIWKIVRELVAIVTKISEKVWFELSAIPTNTSINFDEVILHK